MITDQGRIACANVLSDLYAMGVVDCHNMLMLLAGGIDLDGNDEKHRHLYSSQWPRRCLRQRGTWWFHSWCRFALFLMMMMMHRIVVVESDDWCSMMVIMMQVDGDDDWCSMMKGMMMMWMVMIHLFFAGLPRHRSGGRLLGDRRANGDSNKKLSKLFVQLCWW